jgi:hypothetical protein
MQERRGQDFFGLNFGVRFSQDSSEAKRVGFMG